MPTTLTGLLIFVVLLAPGFVYVVVTERGPFTRASHSVLRETASIALVSLLCDLVALAVYGLAAAVSKGRLTSLRALIEDTSGLWTEDRVRMLLTGLSLLLLACLAALTVAALVNNTNGFAAIKAHRPISWVLPAKGSRTESAWWVVLRHEHRDLHRRVTCYLADGTRVRGWLRNFNPAANESQDRELTLTAPIRLTAGDGTHRKIKSGNITISAHQIQFLHVDYYAEFGESSGPQDPRGVAQS
ncbi:DUF6338 family protein [Nocardioides dongkuii]|uniref:DUF6338 family protein n=1 Tax=Nocardioides dongkuii TaxID=2760089 RepID=UPI0015FA870A|nr:DUF6338 family protein [Nocardioides dongkuii]